MAEEKEEYVFKDATVVIGLDGSKAVIFVIRREGGVALSFPKDAGTIQKLDSTEMELLLKTARPSPMLDEIRDAWRKSQPQ